MATFGELKSRIAAKLDESYLTSQIEQTINSVIDFYEDEHFWFNTARPTITLTSGDPIVPLPTDFLYEVDDGGLTINFSKTRFPIKKVSPLQFDSVNAEGTGIPYIYVVRAGTMEVYFIPDRDYDLEFFYVKSYPDLTLDGESNDWTINADRLIEAKSLSEIFLERRHSTGGNSLYETFLGKADQEFQKLVTLSTQRFATGDLTTENIIDRGDIYHGFYT